MNEENKKKVYAALDYLTKKYTEDERIDNAKKKGNMILQNISSIILTFFIPILVFIGWDFDISWLSSGTVLYEEIIITILIYLITSSLALILGKKFKFEHYALFNYIWPLLSFAITIFISKTMKPHFIAQDINTIAIIFSVELALSFLISVLSWKTGYEEGAKEAERLQMCVRIIDDNKEIVEEILGSQKTKTKL